MHNVMQAMCMHMHKAHPILKEKEKFVTKANKANKENSY